MQNQKYNEIVQNWIKIVEENCEKDAELTLKYCKELIDYGTKIDDNGLIANAYYHEGIVYYVLNDGTNFYEAITKALSYLSLVEDYELMARCYNFLGIFSVNHGNAAIGLDYYLNAMKCCEKAGEKEGLNSILINMGVLYVLYERYDDAIDVLMKAYDYCSSHPEMERYDDYMSCIYEDLAKAYLCRGDLKEARECFDKAYANHGNKIELEALLALWATEVMYYHLDGDGEKCDEAIARVHNNIVENMPILDMFDDFYDYCKVLLERNKEEELWKMVDIMEPMVRSLDITNLMLKILHLKIQYYRKNKQHAEYLQATGLYYEYAERAATENNTMMHNVLGLRKNLELVNKEKKEMEKTNAILRAKSETDALTGLNNRFRFNDYSEKAFQRALEKGTSLCVEILDMDSFKEYNDYYGHQRGDECIQKIASAIKSMEEFGAFTARYGGDEFIIIYEGITHEQAIEYAAELRKRVIELAIPHEKSKVGTLMSISQGLCWDMPIEGNRLWDFLHSADDMLYRVKKKKRNNFCIGNLTEASDQIVMSYL